MATFLELAKIKHHAVRSDGAKFLDGVRDDTLDTSWLSVDSGGRVTLAPGLYDELLVVKGDVSDDQIKAWASMGAPFYDPTPVIPDSQIPSAGEWSSKNKTFYQTDPPVGAVVGDLWVDTDDNDRLYRWDGTKWVDITDKSPVDAEKKPVYVKGAGADIDIDKYGIRATRKTDGTKTFEIDAETGDAYFGGRLSAEKVIGSIAEFGGLTADHIKARAISYDRMNVRFAQLTGFSTGLSPSDYQAIEYVAQNQDEWNLFKMASNNPFQPEETWFITFYHQPLETLVGTFFVQVSSDGVNYTPPIYPPATSVDPTFSAWADLNDGTGNRFRVSSLAVTTTATALLFKKGLGTTSEIYLRFKRHSIN